MNMNFKLFSFCSIVLIVLISVSHGAIQRVYEPPALHPGKLDLLKERAISLKFQ